MIVLADENVDGQIVARLRLDGHRVNYFAETDPGIADPEVLAQSRAAGSLLITADRDFGELIFKQRWTMAGVLLIRLAGLTPAKKAALVAGLIASHGNELAGAFTVLSAGGARIRRRAAESE